MSSDNSKPIWPAPEHWSPETTVTAMSRYKFSDTIFQNMEKEHIATKLLNGLHANGNSWEAGVPKSDVVTSKHGGSWTEATDSLLAEGYIREAEGKLYATEKLKDVLVHTTHERATGITGKMAELEKAALETMSQPKSAAAPLAEEAETATKSGRALYQFATHSLKDGEAVFSAPRTAISGAILLGTGLAAHHFLKSSKPENWQERTQPAADAAATQR